MYTLFQFPCLQQASYSKILPPLSHLCHLGQTVWCQLPTSPALWSMRAPSCGNGPSHLGSPSPRCGSLMGPGPALCRYPRFLQPMKETTHAVPASMDSLLRALLSFNSMVSYILYIVPKTHCHSDLSYSSKTRTTISDYNSDCRQFFSHSELRTVWLYCRKFSPYFMELWWW